MWGDLGLYFGAMLTFDSETSVPGTEWPHHPFPSLEVYDYPEEYSFLLRRGMSVFFFLLSICRPTGEQLKNEN